jgi:hypothetical protein
MPATVTRLRSPRPPRHSQLGFDVLRFPDRRCGLFGAGMGPFFAESRQQQALSLGQREQRSGARIFRTQSGYVASPNRDTLSSLPADHCVDLEMTGASQSIAAQGFFRGEHFV